MNQRPTAVTVVSWLLIVTSALSALSILMTHDNPLVHNMMAQHPIPVPLQYAMSVIGLFVTVISGICMLNGANWARLLYLGWGAFSTLISLLTNPAKLMTLPGLVLFGVLMFILTRPHVVIHFKKVTNECA